MGRTVVEIEVAHYADVIAVEQGRMTLDQVRRVVLPGIVDTGAARLVLPKATADQLGLPVTGQATVRYADHRRETREIVKDAHVRLAGRGSVFTAVVEPARSDAARIGAIVMEELDLVVDCTGQRVIPREPGGILAEIE